MIVNATATQSDTTVRSYLVRPIKTPLNQQDKAMLFLRFLANAAKAIERMHSHDQQSCKFIATNKSVYIRKEFSSHRIGLVHQHDCCFTVLEHQYGYHDFMCIHSICLEQTALRERIREHDRDIQLAVTQGLRKFGARQMHGACNHITPSYSMMSKRHIFSGIAETKPENR